MTNKLSYYLNSYWQNFLGNTGRLIHRSQLPELAEQVILDEEENVIFGFKTFWLKSVFLRENPYKEGLSRKNFSFHSQGLFKLQKAYCHGLTGLVEWRNKILLEPTLNKVYYVYKSGDAKYFLTRKLRNTRNHRGTHLVLSASISDNYFMWVCYFLPLLRYIELAEIEKSSVKIWLKANAPAFQMESLKFLGYERVAHLSGEKLHFESLLIPTFQYLDFTKEPIGHFNLLSKRAIMWLNEQITAGGKTRKLIVSRQAASARRIINAEVLIDQFPEFEIIQLEKMSFLQQITIFASAKIVIASHGAGLTNLVFGKSIQLFEFYPESRPFNNPKNLQICEYLGHDYHLIQLPSINEFQDMEIDEECLLYLRRNVK